jgi:hypothetical protein
MQTLVADCWILATFGADSNPDLDQSLENRSRRHESDHGGLLEKKIEAQKAYNSQHVWHGSEARCHTPQLLITLVKRPNSTELVEL